MQLDTFNVGSLDDMQSFVTKLLVLINTQPTKTAQVVSLSGDLGAGKTTLVQLLAKELRVTETVNSPTFNLMKIYELTPTFGQYEFLAHLDVYRLESVAETGPLQLERYLADPRFLVVIEWAERIKEILPKDTITVKITVLEENKRQIELSYAALSA